MNRKEILLTVVLFVIGLSIGMLLGVTAEANDQEAIGQAKEAIEDSQDPMIVEEEKRRDVPFTVKEEGGKTVLMTDTVDEDTKVTLSFSTLLDSVQTHVDLDSHGLRYRYTLEQPFSDTDDTPIILELEGPAFKDGPGVRLKIRF